MLIPLGCSSLQDPQQPEEEEEGEQQLPPGPEEDSRVFNAADAHLIACGRQMPTDRQAPRAVAKPAANQLLMAPPPTSVLDDQRGSGSVAPNYPSLHS